MPRTIAVAGIKVKTKSGLLGRRPGGGSSHYGRTPNPNQRQVLTVQLDKDRKAILDRKGKQSAGKKEKTTEGDVEMVE